MNGLTFELRLLLCLPSDTSFTAVNRYGTFHPKPGALKQLCVLLPLLCGSGVGEGSGDLFVSVHGASLQLAGAGGLKTYHKFLHLPVLPGLPQVLSPWRLSPSEGHMTPVLATHLLQSRKMKTN